MDFGFSEQEEAFRREVRDFIKGKIPEDVKFGFLRKTDRYVQDYAPCFQQLGKKGWLCVDWPQEYGGLGYPLIARGIVMEELGLAGIERPNIATSCLGRSILEYGNDKLKKEFLPGIARGEIYFSEGLSEPNAGSDLASVQTKARRSGNDYIIDGQKIFTSYAHKYDYCLLLARTAPELPKYKGLSIFVVDMRTPGVTRLPMKDLFGGRFFNEVFFDNVRVPKDYLIGEENKGWSEVMFVLNEERLIFGGGTYCAGACKGIINEVMPYFHDLKERRPLSYSALRYKLAELLIEIEASRLLAYQGIWKFSKTSNFALEASISKLFNSELTQRVVNVAMQVLGLYGQLLKGSKAAPLYGTMADLYIGAIGETIGAGTSEIERTIIGRRLGLPQ